MLILDCSLAAHTAATTTTTTAGTTEGLIVNGTSPIAWIVGTAVGFIVILLMIIVGLVIRSNGQ